MIGLHASEAEDVKRSTLSTHLPRRFKALLTYGIVGIAILKVPRRCFFCALMFVYPIISAEQVLIARSSSRFYVPSVFGLIMAAHGMTKFLKGMTIHRYT